MQLFTTLHFDIEYSVLRKLGSLSNLAISNRDNGSLPVWIASLFKSFWRLSFVISTEATPVTDCAASYNVLRNTGCPNVKLSDRDAELIVDQRTVAEFFRSSPFTSFAK